MGRASHSHPDKSVLLKGSLHDPSWTNGGDERELTEERLGSHDGEQIWAKISHAVLNSYSMTRPPKNWPAHVQYMTVPYFHSSLSGDALSFLKGGRSKGISLPSAPPSLGEVRPIVDPSHPAHRQLGLFATKKIPPQTLIVEYIGEVHSDERPTSDYDISLYHFPTGESVGVDAATMGNEARFVNDYRESDRSQTLNS